MIEIKCTQEEKETIIKRFIPSCAIRYSYCHKYDDCMKCLNNSIKWIITDKKNNKKEVIHK